jgi:KDO2-lipid IV(A) lauroyltransferase
VTGWHHLSNHQHRPIIVLAPHFLGMDAAGVWLSRYFPLMTVYSQQKNAVINAWCKQGRNRWMPAEYQARIIPRQAGLRPVLKGLKAHYPFYYLPDMDFGARDAIFVDFFGTPAATVNALPRLVSATDAMVVPVITRLTPTGYHIDILPPWQNYPDPDLNDAVRRLNQMLEDEIRRDPIQYLWTHKRFKTRPPNEPSLYE